MFRVIHSRRCVFPMTYGIPFSSAQSKGIFWNTSMKLLHSQSHGCLGFDITRHNLQQVSHTLKCVYRRYIMHPLNIDSFTNYTCATCFLDRAENLVLLHPGYEHHPHPPPFLCQMRCELKVDQSSHGRIYRRVIGCQSPTLGILPESWETCCLHLFASA